MRIGGVLGTPPIFIAREPDAALCIFPKLARSYIYFCRSTEPQETPSRTEVPDMRRIYYSLLPVAGLLSVACSSKAQNESPRQVAGGGISVRGWSGQIDPNEGKRGQTLATAKLANDGSSLHVTTGPAVAYWN